jgi:hypothetical protein
MTESFSDIKADYDQLISRIKDYTKSIIDRYRSEISSDFGFISVDMFMNENGINFGIVVACDEADKEFYKSIGDDYNYAAYYRFLPSYVQADRLKKFFNLHEKEFVEFLKREMPEFGFCHDYEYEGW